MYKLHYDVYSTQAESFMAILVPHASGFKAGRHTEKLEF